MNTKNQDKDDSKETTERSPQVGALLRASRKRVGEDLREVSDVLCIRFLYLEAIEECRYSDLPGDTYAVGFIRSYAEHLGLDGEEVVRRYRVEQAGKGHSSELLFPTPVQDSGVPKGAIVFVGFLIAILVYGGWYASTTDESILSDLISPVPDRLKHLVTGDDANEGQPSVDGNATTKATSSDSSSTPAVENQTLTKTVGDAAENATQATTETVEQIADAAGEVAVRAADAAREAAESAAEAVTPENSETSVTTQTVEQAAEPTSQEAVQPEADQHDAAAQVESTVSEVASTDASTASSVEPVASSAAEADATPTPDASMPSALNSETESNAPASSGDNSTATTVPATEVQGNTAEASPQAVDSAVSEVNEAAATPQTPEVTAEDLNSLVLRQATAGDEQSTATPAATSGSTPASTSDTPLSGITIRATSKSWVEVRDPSDGRVLFTGVMSADSTFDVPKISGLVLDTGNAGALDITVNGESVPKIGGIGDVRKSVALDAERLKSGSATTR